MILDEIADYARRRVEYDKKRISLEQIKEEAKKLPGSDFRFEKALRKQEVSLICEVKKASPSKGVISEEFPFVDIAKEYEAAGADCISVLTEPKWFLGSDEIFCAIRQEVSLPMLRKDFTVDEYQIYQAKVMGADAVLLICSLLDTETLKKYLGICNELELSALIETHDEKEIAEAVEAGARIIGVNNRNLHDFTVDLSTAEKKKGYIPKGAVFVAESGVTSIADAKNLVKTGADALLIGEALMRSKDKAAFINQIKR